MAHFARLDTLNNVISIHVLNNSVITDDDGNEQEQLGIDFLTQSIEGTSWYKQTSYNKKFRKNYAGIGYYYDANRDAFIPPKPYASWTLIEETCQWTAPVSHPSDDKNYEWDEINRTWKEI